ncbi:MAG TPA: MFS transporter [Candidatus Sulfopaludibacter sp.]|jgi:MFS family permease|nr:MFS transporter [Candidatus Sulfopaludibacter sp.]
MTSLAGLLRQNPNYRYTWMGQVVSEVGDYFNNVAVLALVMEKGGSGMVVSGVFLSRAIPAVLAGPIAGVLLDRFDRRRIMIASDLLRALVAALFVFTVHQQRPWLLYLLSALLMFASPFFTAGRAAILPAIATKEELHAANSLTQTTSWATLTAGTLLGGLGAAKLGYDLAFLVNAGSFVFSAWCIWKIAWRPDTVSDSPRGSGARDFVDGLRYIASIPLMSGIAMISFGWALGGGAAQVLFALFGEQVFHRGATGIGDIWGLAGVGLLVGGTAGHLIGKRIGFAGYKRAVTVSYLLHGAAYMLFSQTPSFAAALLFMMLSRVGMAVTSVLNNSQLLHHTAAQYRGRVFATMEALRNAVMIVSMAAAGIASQYTGPRTIALIAGAFGALTALAWAWLDVTGHLPDPPSP